MNANVTITDPVSGMGAGFGWLITCTGGTAMYGPAAAEVVNRTGALSIGEVGIASGDALLFSMTSTGSRIKVAVSDSTSKQGATASAPGAPSLTKIAAETTFSTGAGTGNISPIPAFTKVSYSALEFNSATLSGMSPTEFKMYDGTVLQVSTTAINANGGFGSVFKHS